GICWLVKGLSGVAKVDGALWGEREVAVSAGVGGVVVGVCIVVGGAVCARVTGVGFALWLLNLMASVFVVKRPVKKGVTEWGLWGVGGVGVGGVWCGVGCGVGGVVGVRLGGVGFALWLLDVMGSVFVVERAVRRGVSGWGVWGRGVVVLSTGVGVAGVSPQSS